MTTVNELSTNYVALRFFNKLGALDTPSAVTYRIDCLTSGQAVQAPATLAAAPEIVLTIAAPLNGMRVAWHPRETRRVTVVAEYGSANDQVTAEFDYDVVNLRYLPIPSQGS